MEESIQIDYNKLPEKIFLVFLKLKKDFVDKRCSCCLKTEIPTCRCTIALDQEGSIALLQDRVVEFFLCDECDREFQESSTFRPQTNDFVDNIAKDYLTKITKNIKQVGFYYVSSGYDVEAISRDVDELKEKYLNTRK